MDISKIKVEEKTFYSNSLEYLMDECGRIELLLNMAVKKMIGKNNGNNSSFHGLCISDEEADGLIGGNGRGDCDASLSEVEELKGQFARLTEEISEKRKNSIERRVFLSLFVLQNIFRLSPFEIDVLILSLLPEIHKKYERIYGYIQDDITLKRPTLGLICDILSTEEKRGAVLRYFLQRNNLFRYEILNLVNNNGNTGIPSKVIKIDERILNYLFEINDLDSQIVPFTILKIPSADINESRVDTKVKENLLSIIEGHKTGRKKLFINLSGTYGSGRKFTAEALCRKANILLLIADASEIIRMDAPYDVLMRRVFREGILQPAAVYLENSESLFAEEEKSCAFRKSFFKTADELSWITFFGSGHSHLPKERVLNENIFINAEVSTPNSLKRKGIWQGLLRKEDIDLTEADISSLSAKYRFTEGQIADAISSAKNISRFNNGSDKEVTLKSIYEGCKAQSNHRLSTLSQRVHLNYTWEDIVLPEDKLKHLKEITGHVQYKNIVYDEWGFHKKMSIGKGLNILFSGPSGTGKTMAAGVIANELILELYRIDLSSIVSKYIGETEKNLSRVFKEAETSNAILFFDEADALFGKRSEIKDAHDRYANIEVNYLLQKMEGHEGIVILATNLSKNMDDAFLRRMHFTVEFPFPDEKQRCMIWKKVFPEDTPLSKDIDYGFLSDRLKIAGGNIKNIALTSAFYAAKESEEIGMRHIILAAKREYQKIGKSFLKADFEPYYGLAGER